MLLICSCELIEEPGNPAEASTLCADPDQVNLQGNADVSAEISKSWTLDKPDYRDFPSYFASLLEKKMVFKRYDSELSLCIDTQSCQ